VTTLDHGDLESILELISALAETRDLNDHVHTTMHGLMDLIPSIDVSYNEANPSVQRAEYRVWPPPPGDLLTTAMPEGIVVGFALNRDPEGFGERDRAVLNTVPPHLVHAYRTVQLDAGLSMLQHALGATGWTAALVADDAEVRSVTDGGIDALTGAGVDIELGRALPLPMAGPFVQSIASYRPSHPSVLSRPIRLSDGRDGVAGWYVPGPVAPHVALFRGSVDVDTAPRRPACIGSRLGKGSGLSTRIGVLPVAAAQV
jgi:hypothetical protein